VIPELAARLVHTAPDLAPADVAALVDALRANATPLALAIARIVELVADQLVDAGVALPVLAEACDTLCDPKSDARALDAARYRVDTLTPMPGFDVDINLVRRRRT
jgi:hypothetical protein